MARRRSPTPTAELAALTKRRALGSDVLQHEIAAPLNINQGGVSEVLTGKHFPYVPPATLA